MNRMDAKQMAIRNAAHAKRLQAMVSGGLDGFCQGVIADGVVNEAEAEALKRWLEANKEYLEEHPADQIFNLVTRCLADGRLDEAEAGQLLEFLEKAVGDTSRFPTGARPTPTLPINNPQPPVRFTGKTFCLTGEFQYGSRPACAREIERLGGKIHKNVRLDTDYLVLGTACADQWKHGTHGNKITKAMEYRGRPECDLAIVSEDHWLMFLLGE